MRDAYLYTGSTMRVYLHITQTFDRDMQCIYMVECMSVSYTYVCVLSFSAALVEMYRVIVAWAPCLVCLLACFQEKG